jgi:hypothetical protein
MLQVGMVLLIRTHRIVDSIMEQIRNHRIVIIVGQRIRILQIIVEELQIRSLRMNLYYFEVQN